LWQKLGGNFTRNASGSLSTKSTWRCVEISKFPFKDSALLFPLFLQLPGTTVRPRSVSRIRHSVRVPCFFEPGLNRVHRVTERVIGPFMDVRVRHRTLLVSHRIVRECFSEAAPSSHAATRTPQYEPEPSEAREDGKTHPRAANSNWFAFRASPLFAFALVVSIEG
jgi:hypothetical protein